jgi:hypothetical protein
VRARIERLVSVKSAVPIASAQAAYPSGGVRSSIVRSPVVSGASRKAGVTQRAITLSASGAMPSARTRATRSRQLSGGWKTSAVSTRTSERVVSSPYFSCQHRNAASRCVAVGSLQIADQNGQSRLSSQARA